MTGFMVGKMSHEKNNGIFYTPPKLASFVANLAISSPNSKVLDPCYGEAALLLAARKCLLELNSTAPHKQLFGYDIAPFREDVQKNCIRGFLDKKNLKERDFFLPVDRESQMMFDVILMNPPFVRHHLIPKETQKKIRRILRDDVNLPMTSDLWAYFLMHALKFIRKGGTLVSILPWSFLHSDFAIRVRKIMSDKFRTLQVVVIGQRMFKKVEERVLVLIGNGFGFSTSDIGIYYSFGIPKRKICWKQVNREIWQNSLWKSLANTDIHNILSEIKSNLGFKPLSHFTRIRIGTVTGANNFFILNKDGVKRMRPSKRFLKPIIRHSSNLRKLIISASDNIQEFLLLIPEDMELSSSLENYIKKGEEDDINERYHTRNRKKWYSITKQKPPDGFLHYMTKEVPFIVLNPDGMLSTNTIHNVYFLDDVDENSKKWIQFSMLTSISQLSIELLGRTYGGGILKIEPSAAGKILVYSGNGKYFPKKLESELDKLLLKGKLREAVKFGNKWMIENSLVTKEQMDSIKLSYENLRDLRLGENS